MRRSRTAANSSLHRFDSRSRHRRKQQSEGRALSGRGLQAHGAAVAMHGRVDHREPQAGPLRAFGRENGSKTRAWTSGSFRSIVRDRYPSASALFARADRDSPALGRGFDGVHQKIQ